MRREGRVHGSYVRMSKHEEFEYNKGAPRKPTNHSKVSGCCLSNKVRCSACHTAPVLKAMCKTKGKYKLKDLDVTRNYKLDEFAVSCPPSRLVPSSAHFRNYYVESGEDLESSYHSEYEDYEDNNEVGLDESGNHRYSEMMFAVASFLRDMRGAHPMTTDLGTPESSSEEEILDETLRLEFPSELNRQIATETDSDCSWSGMDVSDSEHGGVDVDGWYLVG